MAEFVKFKDGEPVFKPVNMPSGAEAHEAMAEIFGKVGRAVSETAMEIRSEQSNASLYQASNQIYKIKHESHGMMLQYPDQAAKIAKDAENNINMIMSNTPMANQDKQKLEYISKNDITDINLNAIKLGADHSREQAKISFSMQWPDKINQIRSSWSDPKQVEIQTDNARKAVTDALNAGLITPDQGVRYYESIKETFDHAKEALELYQNPDNHTARNYHVVMNKGGKPNNFHQIGAPVDEATNYLYDHNVKQTNFSDIQAAQFSGGRPDPMVYQANLTDNQRQIIRINQKVIDTLNSIINSGASWDELERSEERLESKADSMLTVEERAAKTYLKQWKDGFTKDKYLVMMGHTVIGSQISYEHQMITNAIETNGVYTPEYKQALIREFDNQFVGKMVAAGNAKNIPSDRIMPISSPEVMIAQSAFKTGGNPIDLLNTVDYYNKNNRVYVAAAMKTPTQKEIAYTAGLLEGHTSNELRATLIAANQAGVNFDALKGKEKGEEYISPSIIKMKVQSDPNIQKITNYLSRFKTQPNAARNAAFVDMTTNAVMYQGIQHNDLKLENHEKYIADWGKEYAKGYDIYSGTDYSFNRKQQPQLSDYEWASLAEYAKKKAREVVFGDKRYSDLDKRQVEDINPFYVTITPDNRIIAQDQAGNIAFSQPYDQSMLAYAVQHEKMEKSNLEKKITAHQETRTLSATQMLKERFNDRRL